ncbi:MAG: DUF2062 domain-containing protein [Desulfomonilaceae bacterium]
MKPSTGYISKLWKKIHTIFIGPLLNSRNSPHFDALGVSLGLTIGFLIPVGGQLACLGLIRLFLSFNLIVAGAFTLVSNPLNMIPLYYGYYLIGCLVIGKPDRGLEFSSFEKIMNPIMNADFFWESLTAFLSLSQAFLIRWAIAAVLLSIFFGVFGYLATYRIQQKRIMKAAVSMGKEYQELSGKIKKTLK